ESMASSVPPARWRVGPETRRAVPRSPEKLRDGPRRVRIFCFDYRLRIAMNQLPMSKRVAVVAALVEGNSIRATARLTDVSKPTILKLLADLGTVCAAFHNEHVRNIRSQRIQCDEIWQFV